MNTEEPIPGFNEMKESLLAKLEEPLTEYILCRMKLDQLRKRGPSNYVPEDQLVALLNYHAGYINKILIVE